MTLFAKALSNASENCPLTVFLDSLDQMDNEDDVSEMEWLPTHLPPYVKVVVSTLPEQKYAYLPKLKVN